MKKYIIALGILLPTLSIGQIDRSVRPEPGPAPQINIEDSEVFTTENGMTVILSENDKLPRVSFSLVMGATPKPYQNLAGLPEVAGSLIMSGTKNRSKDQLDQESDYIGARLSADENSMYLSCLTKHMDKGLELMSDVLMNATFPQEEVDRIMKVNESNLLSAKSDAGTMLGNARAVANFPSSHPYGEVMTEESLANMSREAIVQYYRETFTPNGAYLVIVGDINRADAEAAVNKYFVGWNGGKMVKTNLPDGNTNDGNRVIFVNKNGAVQSVISVSFPIEITPSHPDYIKLRVLNGILGGGAFGNRLMQNLREDKAYTYGCRSSVSVDMYGSTFSAGGNFRNEVTDSSITEILYELDRITKSLVEDEELALTKASMAGGFSRSLESPSTVAQFALAITRYDLPKDYYQTYLKKLDAVTKEDILSVAKKYLKPNKANIIVVGNEEIVDRLKQFDADGKIEKMDAFGRAMKDRKKADISAEELFEKHTAAVAMGAEGKALNKKLKKIKSYKTTTEMSSSMMPGKLKQTQLWSADGKEGSKMEMQGMTMQSSYFDGKAGQSTNMQTGTNAFTAEEIAAKQKSQGIIPEMNYTTSGMEYELLGIEEFNGKDAYVVKLNDGESETYKYYDTKTFFCIGSTTITEQNGEAREVSVLFSNFEESNGFMFAKTLNVDLGGFSLEGTITERLWNVKVNLDDFK